MSTTSIPETLEKLDFQKIIELSSSLSRWLNEEMQSIGRASDQDTLKRSRDAIEGIKKIAAMIFKYFEKFEGDLKKSLSFLESDAKQIINQLPRNQKRNLDLSHYVYHHVNENLKKAESSIRLLHGEVSRRRYRAVCARCEEDHTRCQLEVSSEMSKRIEDLSEEIKRKFLKVSETSRGAYIDVFELLLPFIVLPANAEVKGSLLDNWWTGQDWVTSEPEFESLLKNFIEKGIINPVKKKGKSFKMEPHIRAAVGTILVNESFWYVRYAGLAQGKEFSYMDLDRLEIMFNVNEQFPDLAVTAKQLSQMESLRALYLGSWERSTVTAEHDPIRHHIELEDIKFLKALEKMKSLRFLSLRGISLISKFNVRKLINLRTLDLNACWNLSELPDEFESLKNLTHLDISGCYFLQRMPPSFATLSKLQVLKGFVISDQRNSCPLSKLPWRLIKLSIKIVMLGFDNETLSPELTRFKHLKNLKIEWGTGAEVERSRRESSQQSGEINVETLVLHGYPFKMLPSWIVPRCLQSLKKFYIKGGILTKLGEAERTGSPESKSLRKKTISRKDSTDHRGVGAAEQKWNVEILRLKYQGDLEMDWEEVGILFPKLKYLEKVECPRLTSWPCDRNGEWNSAELQV